MYSIAIDGPSSSGKSSLASKIAENLGILHLNTGRLYRALGLYVYENGYFNIVNGSVNVVNAEVEDVVKNAKIDVKFQDGIQHTFLNGRDVTDLLHTPIISDYSSRVSAVPEIRNFMVKIQRKIASENNVVMEGRDITSHVLPNAKYKFFITASVEVRADRRYKEMLEKGINCTYEEILKDLQERDNRDMTRKYCPLKIVEDAIVVDTSNTTLNEAVEKVMSYIKE